MPRTSTTTRPNGQATKRTEDDTAKTTAKSQTDKRNTRGYILMRVVSPDMVSNPHPLDFADGMDSREFVLEKCFKLILEPLEFATEKEWLKFAQEIWDWAEAAELRQKQALVDSFISSIDESALDILKERVAAIA